MGKINWKARFKNKAWLVSFIALIVTVIFQIMQLAGIEQTLTKDDVMETAGLLITVLVGIGVIQDPTTTGICDSERALSYDCPNSTEYDDSDAEFEDSEYE